MLHLDLLASVVQDSTVNAPDRTGVFGPVLDQAWVALAPMLSSAVLWAIAKANDLVRNLPSVAKWAILYFLTLAFNALGKAFGWEGVDPLTYTWTDGAGVTAVQTFAVALVYFFGKHRLPDVPRT